MRVTSWIFSAVLIVIGVLAIIALPQPPARLIQSEFYDGVVGGSDFLQTFSASGTVTGAGILYLNLPGRTTLRRLTCTLLEIRDDASAVGLGRELARGTADVGPFPNKGPVYFSFRPVLLRAGKRYALRIASDNARNRFLLLMENRPVFKPGRLYQDNLPHMGSLAFRVNGVPAPAGALRSMGRGTLKPSASRAIVIGLLFALLVVGGLIAGEAPGPEREASTEGSGDSRGGFVPDT